MTIVSAVPLVEAKRSLLAYLEDPLKLASEHASEVDQLGRFPEESISALKKVGAFGWYVPIEFGGFGLGLEEIAKTTFELARCCSSTAMIFAMHQIQVAALVHHARESAELVAYLGQLTSEQRLIASVTSEVGVGGDLRRSLAYLEYRDAGAQFSKKASAISYGAYADDFLITLRRGPDADEGNQVLALVHRSAVELVPTGGWDALGMRGTCSSSFIIRGACHQRNVFETPFSTVAVETMVPFSHILWANAWLGIATAAFDRAQRFVRMLAHQTPGTTPPAAIRLAELSVRLQELRSLVGESTREFASLLQCEGKIPLSSIGFAVRINNLKISASEAVVEICQGALRVCGFQGYKNDGPFSVGRHLRDALSATLMIANDRLFATNAALLLMHRSGQ